MINFKYKIKLSLWFVWIFSKLTVLFVLTHKKGLNQGVYNHKLSAKPSFFLLVFVFFLKLSVTHAQYCEDTQPIFQQVISNPIEGRKEAMNLLNLTEEKEKQALLNNIIGLSYAIISKTDSAIYHFDKGIELLEENHEMLPRIFVNKAILHRNNNNLESAIFNIINAENIANNQNNKSALPLIYGEYSSIYSLLARDIDALEYIRKAIAILEEENVDVNSLAIEKQKLGNIYLRLKDYDFAKKIYDEILPTLKQSPQVLSYLISKINYAEIIEYFGDANDAVEYLESILDEISAKESDLVLQLYYSKLAKYLSLVNSDRANQVGELAVSLALKTPTTYTLSIVSQFMERLFIEKRFERLNEIIKDLDVLLDYSDYPLVDLLFYNGIKAMFFEATGDCDKAFEALKTEKELAAQKQLIQSGVSAKEAKTKYKNDILSKENLLLIKEAELQYRKSGIIYISLVGSLGVLFLLYRLSLQKRKNAETKNKMYIEKLEVESKLSLLQQKNLEEKKKEIRDLINKNLLLGEQLNEFKKVLSASDNKIKLITQLDKIQPKEEYWEELIYKLRVVEKDFFLNLMNRFPDLTKKEIDFCALVRIGLEYKQIANILSITHNSVITKKYRLTKKLQLNEDEDFQNWIMTI